ncbi:hypothetical protein LTR85_010094 [Meristemomyces frigidus]|nr:hypothetical protein LTR85_010094 [Meristemomyces frigidus]
MATQEHEAASQPAVTGLTPAQDEQAQASELSLTGSDHDNGRAKKEHTQVLCEASLPSESDVHVVSWDGPDDPANPFNWPLQRRVINGLLISLLALVTPLASSFFAPGVPQLMEEFGRDSDLLAGFVVSVYVLGFAFGPLIMAPMSEIYGRNIVYHTSNVGFVVCMVACAVAPSLNALIVFRFFGGVFGSTPLTNAEASIADMVTQEQRAGAVGATAIGPLLGPIIGPVAGGFLSAAEGWRRVYWVLAIVNGLLTILMFVFMRETYAPLLLQRKTNRLRKETGNSSLRSKFDNGLSPYDSLRRAALRPIKLLSRSPLVMVFSIYMAIVYGYLYLLFTSVTEVFEGTYGFSESIVGLVYLGIGVGTILGLGMYATLSNRAVKKAIAAQGGEGPAKPEIRLQLLPAGAVVLPTGLFLYGWTAQYHIHWIVPILGMALIGFGNFFAFMAINMYLVEAHLQYAASAIAAVTLARSIGGALLPLAGLKMYATLGLGWGNSLFGFIAIALIPVPLIILRYGEGLREKYQIKDL